MIKLQMHPISLEGKPLPETGEIISGENANDIIEIMKLKSPFTADMSEQEYIDNILAKLKPDREWGDVDATEFLSKLAEKGFISFLPNEETIPTPTKETTPCADKPE